MGGRIRHSVFGAVIALMGGLFVIGAAPQAHAEPSPCPVSASISGNPWPNRILAVEFVSCGGNETIQWYRDGALISGAMKSSYTVRGADVGHTLSVTVNGVGSATVAAGFADVEAAHTFFNPIVWAANRGLTTGSGDGSVFEPSKPVNRGSMAQFLYRLAGEPTYTAPDVSIFADVKKGDQFYKAISWLSDQGITQGVTIKGVLYYEPKNAVNRASMAAFLKRMADNPQWVNPAISPFVDVATDHTFYGPITWLAATGITKGISQGDGLYYQPTNAVNRGSMTAFLKRLAEGGYLTAKNPITIAGVSISGQNVPGGIVEAQIGTLTPDNVSLSYQWLRNGKVIAGSVSSSYALSVSDVGSVIQVRVVASKSGWWTASALSANSVHVIPANPGDVMNCGSFSSQAEAQAWFDYYYEYYGDVAKLDSDNDLAACQSYKY